MIRSHTYQWVIIALLIMVAAAAVLLPYSPGVMPMPQRDSGIFLYTGWRVLQGELPYRDVWDHKPPVIYYIDALGLISGSVWGVWILELGSLFFASLLCFHLVSGALGSLAGAFGVGLLLISLFPILQGGNLTTEYALPLQFACLWLARHAEQDEFRSIRGLAIGVLTGLMFFIRPNTIGVGLAILVYLTLHRLRCRQIRRWSEEMLVILLGGLVVAGFILGYFAVSGALSDLWDAAFHFNAVYASVGSRQRLISLAIGLGGLASSGLLQLAILGFGFVLSWLVYRPQTIPIKMLPLMAIFIVDLPVELVLVNLPGHAHPHYLIALLPVLTWFAGLIFWLLLEQLERLGTPVYLQRLYTMAVLALFVWVSLGNIVQTWRMLRQGQDARLANDVIQMTGREESVLVWGADGGINFTARRRSPTRYVYLTPLYTNNYTDEDRILQFMDGLLRSPPTMILDAPNDEFPIFEFPLRSLRIDERVEQLRQHYQLVGEMYGWRAYR